MNAPHRLNQILHYLATRPQGAYVLDYCVGEFGGYRADYFELLVQLLLDGYVHADTRDLQYLRLTPEGLIFIQQAGYNIALKERILPEKSPPGITTQPVSDQATTLLNNNN